MRDDVKHNSLGKRYVPLLNERELQNVAESICTHYSNSSGRLDILLGSGTFKKLGTLLFQKTGCPIFFQGHKPTLVFKTRIVGAD